ncbi:hypothetical protein [Absidia glauca]|uniref:Uncharacterized protein n=1 Tax=Absidia glauca TaxID=4829 RepID=A0A168L9V7_ABSGL|nr:hypothetical protein [Absidia glauca]
MIRRLGPMPPFSCRSVERTIGHYKQRTLSTQLPGISYRKLPNSIQANGPLLLISSLECHHLHDIIELMLENELHINNVLALEQYEDDDSQDVMTLTGQPVYSSEPPFPATLYALLAATNWYLRTHNTDSDLTISSENQFAYHHSMKYGEKTYRSIDSQSFSRAAAVKFGQATVLVTATADEWQVSYPIPLLFLLTHFICYSINSFFGLVYFFFEITVGNKVHKLAAIQALQGVEQNTNIYPIWYHGSGHFDRLIVVGIECISDAVGILVDTTKPDIKHLVPARQPVWNLKVLTNIDDIILKLRRDQ